MGNKSSRARDVDCQVQLPSGEWANGTLLPITKEEGDSIQSRRVRLKDGEIVVITNRTQITLPNVANGAPTARTRRQEIASVFNAPGTRGILYPINEDQDDNDSMSLASTTTSREPTWTEAGETSDENSTDMAIRRMSRAMEYADVMGIDQDVAVYNTGRADDHKELVEENVNGTYDFTPLDPGSVIGSNMKIVIPDGTCLPDGTYVEDEQKKRAIEADQLEEAYYWGERGSSRRSTIVEESDFINVEKDDEEVEILEANETEEVRRLAETAVSPDSPLWYLLILPVLFLIYWFFLRRVREAHKPRQSTYRAHYPENAEAFSDVDEALNMV